MYIATYIVLLFKEFMYTTIAAELNNLLKNFL